MATKTYKDTPVSKTTYNDNDVLVIQDADGTLPASMKKVTIADLIAGYNLEKTTRKKAEWSATPSDDNYPTEKLVKDTIDEHTSKTDNPHSVTKVQVGLGNVPNTDFTTPVGNATTHIARTDNPHGVTKAQVGLGNVPNTDFTQRVTNLEGKTKLSDFTNDLGLIDNTVNNLVNYYKKTETYTQAEVDSLISSARTGGFRVVATLPTASAECIGYIYLVPKSRTKTQNVKDEYICVAQGTTPETYAWEKIGDTEVDLTEYRKAADQDTIDAGKVDKVTGKGLSTNDYSDDEKQKVSDAYGDKHSHSNKSVLDGISTYLKNATLSQDEKTLTLTKQDGSTVDFQGGNDVGLSVVNGKLCVKHRVIQ